ncbi:hypothetical protein [Prescottella sp. R16]|uniref:hypothetical protein n=1 Tax=Prescottella sp. R16 TaxID=3064529 RepID=UPI00272DCB82|nr:hypothetical protein [Prescottella sp. R16]
MTLPYAAAGGSVELRCILRADQPNPRSLPQLVVFACAIGLLVMLVVGLIYPRSPEIYWPATVAVAVGATAVLHLRNTRRLRARYDAKRLVLSPTGLTRIDAATIVEIPWNGLTGVCDAPVNVVADPPWWMSSRARTIGNAATAALRAETAVVLTGRGVVRPVPGASRRILAAQDQALGSRLQAGEPFHTPAATINAAEFEEHWRTGTIGAWVHRYRPDLRLG